MAERERQHVESEAEKRPGRADEEVPARRKLAKSVGEFQGYIRANEEFIPNYGDRHYYGEGIATAFGESTVNQVVSKRFVQSSSCAGPGAARPLWSEQHPADWWRGARKALAAVLRAAGWTAGPSQNGGSAC